MHSVVGLKDPRKEVTLHMYDFAIVALLGLTVWKTVGMLFGMFGKDLTSSVRTLITLALGVATAYVLDYSLFAGWNISVANSDVAKVFTGLMIGSSTYVWHYVVGLVEATGRHHRDEAREIETRSPRAA